MMSCGYPEHAPPTQGPFSKVPAPFELDPKKASWKASQEHGLKYAPLLSMYFHEGAAALPRLPSGGLTPWVGTAAHV